MYTSPTAGGIDYAKAKCMDTSKEITNAIAQCAIINKLFHIYSHLCQYDLLLFHNRYIIFTITLIIEF